MAEKDISVFIDESGDFGPFEPHAPIYLVALVLHDRSVDIRQNILDFDRHLEYLGYKRHAVHTGPLIRRESEYAYDLMEARRSLFGSLFHFVRRLPVRYSCIKVNKRECGDSIALAARIGRELGGWIDEHKAFFGRFDRVTIYYDNGQVNLTRIISAVFSSHLPNVNFQKVLPVDCRLLQVADLVCKMELLAGKAEDKAFTKSETEFFGGIRDFRRNYLKWIQQKRL